MADQAAVKDLAPTGVLRAAVNLSNPLLVTGKAANGDPQGVSPDMAKAIADELGVAVRYVTYPPRRTGGRDGAQRMGYRPDCRGAGAR